MSFQDEYEFKYITTEEIVAEYKASNNVFEVLLLEIKVLSKKKPDATLNKGKVKIVNRVLENLLIVLNGQPEAKYLEILDDADLPQVSDAVLIMVQFKSALRAFENRHHRRIDGKDRWVTQELVSWLEAEYEEAEEE